MLSDVLKGTLLLAAEKTDRERQEVSGHDFSRAENGQ
jgi:hypothetical protein